MLVSKSERAREREREKDQLLTKNNLHTDRREMQKKKEQSPCVVSASWSEKIGRERRKMSKDDLPQKYFL